MSYDIIPTLIHTTIEKIKLDSLFFQEILKHAKEYNSTRNDFCIELIIDNNKILVLRLEDTISSLKVLQESDFRINLPKHGGNHLYSLYYSSMDKGLKISEKIWHRTAKLIYVDPSFDTVFIEVKNVLTGIKESLAVEMAKYEKDASNVRGTKTLDDINLKWLNFIYRIKILFIMIKYLRKIEQKKY